jgi:hypothetical protein
MLGRAHFITIQNKNKETLLLLKKCP